MYRILFLIGAACATTAASSAQIGRPPIRVDDPLAARNPDQEDLTVRGDGDLVVTMWTDERNLSFSDDDIWIAVSQDAGLSWAPEIQVTNYGAFVFDVENPVLAVSEDVIHIAFTNDSLGGAGVECLYMRSLDFGQTWDTTTVSTFGYLPQVHADGPYVAIVWQDELQAQRYYYSIWSDDYGVTFGSPQTLDPFGIDPQGVFDMEVTGNRLHAAFVDERWLTEELRYCSSLAGAPWSPSIRVDPGLGDLTYDVQLRADGSALQLTWLEERRDGSSNDRVYSRSSPDDGTTWTAEVQLSPTGFVNASHLGSGVDGNVGAICWVDDRDGSNFKRVRVATTVDAGATWGAPVALPLLEPGDHKALYANAFVHGETILVACDDQSGGVDTPVFYWSNDAGQIWHGPVELASEGFGVDDARPQHTSFWSVQGGILGAWHRPSMPDPPGIFISGARRPYLLKKLSTDSIEITLVGAEPGQVGATARLAIAWDRQIRASTHPLDPSFHFDLAFDPLFQRTFAATTILTQPLDAQGAALFSLTFPPGLPDWTYQWQGWVENAGLPLGGTPSDVLPFWSGP